MSNKLREALERILRYIELDAYVRSVCAQDCDQNKLRELYRSPSIKELASTALAAPDEPAAQVEPVADVGELDAGGTTYVDFLPGWHGKLPVGTLLYLAATPSPTMAPIGKDGSTAAWPGIDYTSDEYARPDLAPNWIPWIGGAGTPASPTTKVCVKYRDGTEMKTPSEVRGYAWYWTNEDDDIVAYRIIES